MRRTVEKFDVLQGRYTAKQHFPEHGSKFLKAQEYYKNIRKKKLCNYSGWSLIPSPVQFPCSQKLCNRPSSVNESRIIAKEAIKPYELVVTELPLFSVGPGSAL